MHVVSSVCCCWRNTVHNFTFSQHYFLIIKPNRFTNFTNLFWHETLHVSDSSSVHHQQFILCTLGNFMSYRFVDSFRSGSSWSWSKVVRVISSPLRPLRTRHTKHNRRITVPSTGFESHDSSNRAALNLRLKPHGHREWPGLLRSDVIYAGFLVLG